MRRMSQATRRNRYATRYSASHLAKRAHTTRLDLFYGVHWRKSVSERLQPAASWALRSLRLRDARLDNLVVVALSEALAGARCAVACVMAFPSWCACHAFDVRQRLEVGYVAFKRRQCAADARRARATYFRDCVALIDPRIARELAGEFEL